MGKIRVYELAKELGVENRFVITKAEELGISGVRSHSNSLQPDEADQIRRLVIRQAVEPRQESEVVKTAVDRSTGESRTIVERRRGNVIRRRKASDDDKLDARGDHDEGLDAEVIDPDSLFEDSSEDVRSPTEESIEPPEAVSEEQQSLEEGEQPEPVQGVSASVETEEPEQEKIKVGPKVLGKIDLPTAPTPVKKSTKKKATTSRTEVRAEEIFDEDEEGDARDGASKKKRSKKRAFSMHELVDYEGRGSRRIGRPVKQKKRAAGGDSEDLPSGEGTTPKASKRVVRMDELITVGDLAAQLSLKASEVIGKLIQLGVMATINQVIDQDTATIISDEFGFTVESTTFDEGAILDDVEEDKAEDLVPRSPVVTVMGHVDHGKTSLLDRIRKTSVVDKEHGGITQHIGAYQVVLPGERRVTFIDTPGHAAFTSMRARGAHVTDIVILVVAADDGVMPQTVEAISHAQAAGVPIIVAVNKVDKPQANPERVKQQLAERGLQPEDWGGDVMYFPVSALTGAGVEELIEGALLIAEIKEMKANPGKRARGTIIESRQEKGLGTVSTVLIQDGTLRVGDIYVTGSESGRIRSLMNERGERLEEAGPSMPVEITGLSGVPQAGDDFVAVESEAMARSVALNRSEIRRKKDALLFGGPISLEEFSRRAGTEEAAELRVIVKADVHGSLEAVREALQAASVEKVAVRVIHGGIGAVNESDIQLAIASQALIVGFNVRSEPRAMAEGERQNVEVRFYRIIYELVDDIKKAMAGLLAPLVREKSLGRVEVRDTFSIPKIGKIAGAYVTTGTIRRGGLVRLLRDSTVVFEGKMGSLRRFKEDVKEVQAGYECGISIHGFQDVKVGDEIEVYELEEFAATLE